jgi:hypothetical protein
VGKGRSDSAPKRHVVAFGLTLTACGGGVVEASSYSASSTDAEGSDGAPSSATVGTTMTTSVTASAGETSSASLTDASAEDPSATDASAEDASDVDPSGTDTLGTDDGTGTAGDDGSESEGTTTGAPCVPTDEMCDALDNDCDGIVDEGAPTNLACGNCLFVLSSDGTAYFAVCADFVTWDGARTECAAFGDESDLAIIGTAADQSALLLLLLGDTWVGLSDSAEEGHWVWVDGTDSIVDGAPVGYDGWAATQPEGGGQNCGELDPLQAGWADATCTQLQPYICRHPI